MDDKEIKCCIGCGRDTRSKSGICMNCLGHGSRRGSRDGYISNPATDNRDVRTLGGAAVDDLRDFDEEYIRRKTEQ